MGWQLWRRGPRDEVSEQLRDLERQGSGSAALAHLAAFALVVVFSAGSLVALSGEAITHLVASAQAGRLDVPSAISIAVSTLLVVAMDMALIVAAATVRMLRLRRQEGAALHVAVIIGVSLVEASTYVYMSWLYDRPDAWPAWALIVARAISAPLMATYLSLARSLPVSARDILGQVELATGRGVVRDMVRIAADLGAPLERKLALYRASSVMTPADAARLDALIAQEQITRDLATAQRAHWDVALSSPAMRPEPPLNANLAQHGQEHDPDTPPDGPEPSLPPAPTEAPSDPMTPGVVTPFTARPRRRPKPLPLRRRDRAAADALEATRRRRAFALLDSDAEMSANAIARRLHCRHERASAYKAAWDREREHDIAQ